MAVLLATNLLRIPGDSSNFELQHNTLIKALKRIKLANLLGLKVDALCRDLMTFVIDLEDTGKKLLVHFLPIFFPTHCRSESQVSRADKISERLADDSESVNWRCGILSMTNQRKI